MQNSEDEQEIVGGINITPMVDITLVLLIIFMVTATFMAQSGLKVNLPKAVTTEAAFTASLTVTLDSKGYLYLMKSPIDEKGLRAALQHEVRLNPGVKVTIAADKKQYYEQVIHILDLVKQAGISKVALAAER